MNTARLCRKRALSMKLAPHPQQCVRETPMFMMLRAVPTVGGERGLPFLPGHCRCHTEKEDKRMSISAQIESCFCYCYRKKKVRQVKEIGNIVSGLENFFRSSAVKRNKAKCREALLLDSSNAHAPWLILWSAGHTGEHLSPHGRGEAHRGDNPAPGLR